jgi:hypothetical protein
MPEPVVAFVLHADELEPHLARVYRAHHRDLDADGPLAVRGLEIQVEMLTGLDIRVCLQREAAEGEIPHSGGLAALLEPEGGPEVHGETLVPPTLPTVSHVALTPLERVEPTQTVTAAEGIDIEETGEPLEQTLAGDALDFGASTAGAMGNRHVCA